MNEWTATIATKKKRPKIRILFLATAIFAIFVSFSRDLLIIVRHSKDNVVISSPATTSKRTSIITTAAPFALFNILTVFMPVDAMKLSPSSNANIPFVTSVPYVIPNWCRKYFTNPPKHGRFQFANLPTPLYRVLFPSTVPTTTNHSTNTTSVPSILQKYNFALYMKRDDATHGIELGGNKIRKLEFLLAEAVAQKRKSIITIGGVQSNHCRATAGITRMIGLEPHLILRQPATAPSRGDSTVSKKQSENDIGFVGNLLFDRMVGSRIYTCTAGEYGRIGSIELLQRVATYLQTTEGHTPYIIPVGGSNGVGTWGYINAVDELLTQWNDLMRSKEQDEETELHHIVVACGSGGTTAGIALGIALAYHHSHNAQQQQEQPNGHNRRVSNPPVVHAIGVCDDADYFFNHVAKIADEMGFVAPNQNKYAEDDNDDGQSSIALTTEQYIREHLVIHQGKGRGYGQSTKEELEFMMQFAKDTGIVLDPVYTGKALYNFFQYIQQQQKQISATQPNLNENPTQNILFWHTGGGLGLFDKCHDIFDTLVEHSPCQKLDLYGNGNGVDISGK